MNALSTANDGGDGVPPALPHHPSTRVRLEAALLDADEAAASVPAPTSSAALDGRAVPTVLVVAADADLRRYVRECLRECPELRVVEATTLAAAVALAAVHAPACLVVDAPEREVLRALAPHRAILLDGDVPHDASPSGPYVRLLAGPFTAEELVVEVRRLVG